jgi:ribosomal protein S18 acetylase RimI-like enzyme
MNARPFTEDDAPAVAALIARDDEALYGRPSHVSADDILRSQHFWKEAWIYEEDGCVIASAAYGMHGDAASIRGVVGEKGRGVGTLIADRGEDYARANGAARIHVGFAEPDIAARRLFESRGYHEVRRFYEMAIELQEEPLVPQLSDGLLVDELREGEERVFYDAVNEAFQEHWEWHPLPFDEWIELRRGQHHDEHGPVWFVVRDSDELAAVTRNDANANGGGYVGAIGVRPAWRGRGLAKVLLARTFAEFWRRGSTRVTLDVDTQNETGATQLYERAGMHVESCGVVFEKT